MADGGFQWSLITVLGAGVLFVALLWAVLRVRSNGRKSSSATTEQATRDVYRQEEVQREKIEGDEV